jgi:CheY-like chemotaxis protein
MNKTDEMIKYEKETGKQAIWRGVVTKDFKKFQKGEKIYHKEKERINILISEETKQRWLQFINENEITTISKLIRESVDSYIDIKPKLLRIQRFEESFHNLKEKLSSIKGFSQILIGDYKNELNWDVLLKIKEIYDQSLNLEKILYNILNDKKDTDLECDLLIVDDDVSTIILLSDFFRRKGIICKEISNGLEALEFLKNSNPKLVLLDILLPDTSGYEICKTIKSDKKFRDVPIFYITAVPESEVKEKMKDTKADGYYLKPFDMSKFNELLNYF